MTDPVTLEIIRRMSALEEELRRLSSLTALFRIGNMNTPAQITADQNDYNPGDYDILILSASGAYNITGFSGGVTGRLLYVTFNGINSITLVNGSVLSLPANRIFNYPAGTNITLTNRRTALLRGSAGGWLTFFVSA